MLGAAFVHYCRPMLPFTMSLAAGAMIFVVCDSLVPEMQVRCHRCDSARARGCAYRRVCARVRAWWVSMGVFLVGVGGAWRHEAVRGIGARPCARCDGPAMGHAWQAHGNKGLAMQGLMLGFVIMMILDVALG